MKRLALLLVPALIVALPASAHAGQAVTAADAAADDVLVTAVVEAADGSLSFRTAEATSPSAGQLLARRWDRSAEVIAAGVEQPMRAFADPLDARQWGLARLRSPEAQALSRGAGQVVAVVDTGVDSRHPDLVGTLVPGRDFLDPTATGSVDPNGHGTHIAGVVAAVPGNGIGGSGLAPGAKVMPIRVLGADGSGSDADVARGVTWAVDNGATVINLSLGGPSPSAVLNAVISYAGNHDVLVVVAAGNDGERGDPILYPAASPGVLAVGAVDRLGTRPRFSSTGNHLGLVAPGVDVLSTMPGGGYAMMSGTSMAAPWVAAAAALLRSAQPSLPAGAVLSRLLETADDLGPAGRDRGYGAGIINPLAALAGTPPVNGTAPGGVAPGAPAPAASPVAPVAPPQTPPAGPPVAGPPVAGPPVAGPPVAGPPAAVSPPAGPPQAAPASGPSPQGPPAVVPAPGLPSPTAREVQLQLMASASSITAGSPVALTASMSSTSGPLAGPVQLEVQGQDGSWRSRVTGRTGPTGDVSWSLRPDRAVSLRVTAGAVSSAPVRVTVRQVVTMTVSRAASRSTADSSSTAVAVHGAVLPGGRVGVRLEAQSAGRWVTVARTTTNAQGRYVMTRALPVRVAVRTVVDPRPGLLAAESAPMRAARV